jgi:TRAP transporter 4TM/12TM fusion protein
MRAALSGLGLCVVVGMIRKETRLNLTKFVDTFEAGARGILGVAVACATAGIIIGVVTLTGLGLKMGYGLFMFTGGMLLPTLFLTMISSLILGMGVPTTANYVITSMVAAPAILQLGVPVVAAHMFVFYFGIIADITPPVALAAMAGAAIARSNPFMTGVAASKLAIAAFLVPYIFVYNPSLLLINATLPLVIQMVFTAVTGMVCIGAAVQNYYLTNTAWWERIFLFVGGILLIDPATLTDIIGLAIFCFITAVQYRKFRASRPLVAARIS